RGLALGQTINVVVEHDVGDVDVAPGRVGKVPAADRQAVAVTAHRDHGELRVADLHAHRRRKHAAVDAVESVGIDEDGQAPPAADAGPDHHVLGVEVQRGERLVEGIQDGEVAAARAPGNLNV